MRKYPCADVAWIVLGVAIVTYEVSAPKGQLLSEGWDRYLQKHPVIARLLPVVLTLHVINAVPDRVDPVHQGLELVKALRGIK